MYIDVTASYLTVIDYSLSIDTRYIQTNPNQTKPNQLNPFREFPKSLVSGRHPRPTPAL